MRTLHVFTLQSPENAFGGPIRVALNLSSELKKRGFKVELLGGCRGYEIAPSELEETSAHLFPVRQIHEKLGFSGIFSISLLSWAWRNVRNYDIVHVHMARDLITLPVAFICKVRKVPYVIQGHGMIDPTTKPAGRVLDALLVKRVLRGARRLLFLTEQEKQDYPAVAGGSLDSLTFLPNGVPNQARAVQQNRSTISYISRLQARKRPERFVEMARQLIANGITADFKIAGADEGELRTVKSRIAEYGIGEKVTYLGAKNHQEVLGLLAETAVLVLPSINEPFPMIVLEAISLGVPVVITDTCGLAPYIKQGIAGIVTDGSVEQLSSATSQILVQLSEYSANAKSLAEAKFSMAQIGDDLVSIYSDAVSS